MNGPHHKLFLLVALFTLATTPAGADEGGVILSDMPTPGDGKTASFLQYLDGQGYSSSPVKGLSSGSVTGETVYKINFDSPPGVLRPNLGLAYSSDGDRSTETTLGWSLTGITEIRRPLDQAHADDEWLISAPEFSGTLTSAQSTSLKETTISSLKNTVINSTLTMGSGESLKKYDLKTSTPLKVSATYSKDDNEWIVYADNVTYTLKAADDGKDTAAGTAVWRVRKITDAVGNEITFKYDRDHCLKTVYYGDNLVKIEFTYDDNTTTYSSAKTGSLITYKKHLTSVIISTSDNADTSSSLKSALTATSAKGGGLVGLQNLSKTSVTPVTTSKDSYTRRRAYTMTYTTDNSVDLLQKITLEGETSSSAEILATFAYSTFNAGGADRQDAALTPSSLGESWSYSEPYDFGSSDNKNGWMDIYLESLSGTSKMAADFNCDGLVDVMSTAGEIGYASEEDNGTDWRWTTQTVDYGDRSFGWSDEMEIYPPQLFLQAPRIYLSKFAMDTPKNIKEYFQQINEQHALHQTVDVDGDGYLDVIETTLDDDQKATWAVHYGAGGGFTKVEENNPPDWTYTQYNQSLNVFSSPNNDPVTMDEVTKQLIDLNGDGGLDAYDPKTGEVYYYKGTRGEGWDQTPTTLNYKFDSMRRVTYTITSHIYNGYTEACANTCKAGCAYDNYTACDDGSYQNCDEWEACFEECVVDHCREDEGYKVVGYPPSLTSNADQFRIDQVLERQAFYDLNGDGLPDFVDATSTPWSVYLNNGSGFEAPVEWTAPSNYMRQTSEGYPNIHTKVVHDNNCGGLRQCGETDNITEGGKLSMLLQMLEDVDNDGLIDLAMSKDIGGVWYKNLGDRFDTTAKALPAWYPRYFMTSMSDAYQEYGYPTVSATYTMNMLADLDHDGAVDSVETGWVKYGNYPKPYLLTKISDHRGGLTEMSYRSLATVSPSGDRQKWQYTPNVKALADVITTTDSITGQTAKVSMEYKDGYFADGIFRGFGTRTVTQYKNDKFTDKTETTFELSYNLPPLVMTQKLYTDFNLGFGDEIKRGDENLGLRFAVENSYVEKGTSSQFKLLEKREVVAYGESSGSETTTESFVWDDNANMTFYENDGAGEKNDELNINMSYTTDAANHFSRMATKLISGTDPLDNDVRAIAYTRYYYDDNEDTTDDLSAGLLTKTLVSAGWHDGGDAPDGEFIEYTFGHGSHGELTSAKDETSGIEVTQTFGFAGAKLQTQTDGLGHKLTRTIDNQGRITSITDDNGLSITTAFDSLGRVSSLAATGKNGSTHKLNATTYHVNTAPYYTTTYNYSESGAIDSTDIDVQDSSGNIAQNWRQNSQGDYEVTNQFFDLYGAQFATSHPVNQGSSFAAPTTITAVKSNTFSQYYYDALGKQREIVRDAAKKTGARQVLIDKPFQELHTDENGYQTRLTYDAFHRLIKVEQGKPGNSNATSASSKTIDVTSVNVAAVSVKNTVSSSKTTKLTSADLTPTIVTAGPSDTSRNEDGFAVTAKYAYDPENRLVKFTDGNGITYSYSYDAAGRLRQVRHGKVTSLGADTVWYTNEYQGNLKTRVEDASGAYVTYVHDKTGRVTTMTVSDSLPGASGKQTYTYTHDTNWIGAVAKITDATGYTDYTYDDLGNVSSTKRTYNDSAVSATFSYDYDLTRPTKVTFPSGHEVASTYAYGVMTGQSATTAGTTDYTLSYDYNKWGLVESVTSSLGHKYKTTYTTPLWIDQIAFSIGTHGYTRDFNWYDNGLLKSKSVDDTAASDVTDATSSTLNTKITGITLSSVKNLSSTKKLSTASITAVNTGTISMASQYTYSYDDLKELTKVASGIKTLESFAYDNAGALTDMTDVSGIDWTYTAGSSLNRVASRSSGSGTETYSYDDAGRVSEIKSADNTTNYYYDGLGRLRGVMKNGTFTMVLDYDAEGNLTRRADNNPFTGSANFVFHFQGWRYNSQTGVVTEVDSNMVSAENGERRWTFGDSDNHVSLTFDDVGTVISDRSLGAYGAVKSSSGTAWDWNAFHGMEAQDNLTHMGQRHVMQDGQWLQPEPMLYAGFSMDKLADPLSMASYRYARNMPTVMKDVLGTEPQEELFTPHSAVDEGLIAGIEYYTGEKFKGKVYLTKSSLAKAVIKTAVKKFGTRVGLSAEGGPLVFVVGASEVISLAKAGMEGTGAYYDAKSKYEDQGPLIEKLTQKHAETLRREEAVRTYVQGVMDEGMAEIHAAKDQKKIEETHRDASGAAVDSYGMPVNFNNPSDYGYTPVGP